jgi:cytochrome d ubiquinol oxidase subunit I
MLQDLTSPVMLARLQFAYTALFHILWPVLIVGLSIFLVVLELLWLRTKEEDYYHHLRFWTKLFLLNLAVGVVTGIPLEFQFGTNWSRFSIAGGDVFGHLLGFETTIAFMLEASFLSILAFGWNRVSPAMHLFATTMVAAGASLSVFWIMDANAWMQTPAGGYFEGKKFILTSNLEAIFNPNMIWAFSHKEVACLMITAFVVAGISGWYILRDRHAPFFLKSFKMAVLSTILLTPLQIYLGDGSGVNVYEYQPAKLAAMEAHWQTNGPGEGAPWRIIAWPDPSAQENVFEVNIPYGLSLITSRTWTGVVQGLREFPKELQPPVWLPFYSFRIMIVIGFGSFFLMLYTVWAWTRGRLHVTRIANHRRLLIAWVVALPFPYVAMEAGWVVREVGRQPWVIYNVLRTESGVSPVAGGMVGASLVLFASVYTLLFVLFLVFARRILKKGPGFEPPPSYRRPTSRTRKGSS